MTRDVTSALGAFRSEYQAMREMGQGWRDQGLAEPNEMRNHLSRLASEVQKHCESITRAYDRLKKANPDKLPFSIAPAINGSVGECLQELKRASDQLDGGKMLNETDQKELFSHTISRLQTAVQTSGHRQ